MFDLLMSVLLMVFLGAILTACLHMVLVSIAEVWRQPYAKINWRTFQRKETKRDRKKTKR